MNMIGMFIRPFVFAICVWVGLGVPAAYAQTTSEFPQTPMVTSESIARDVKTGDATVAPDSTKLTGYVRGTPANLSKLYWNLGVFDSGDDRAVDNFMLINECDIYQNNVNNDFEWKKIRESAKKFLNSNREKFSTQFEFVLPVELGTYDEVRKGFPIMDVYAYNNVRRFEIWGNSLDRELCGRIGEVKDYPRNLMLIMEQAFTYNFVPVDEHVAQAFLVRKQKEVLDIDTDVRQQRYKRVAYVRLRVNFHEYLGSIRGRNGSILAILEGKLDGIDLFEDANSVLLLSSSKPEDLITSKPR
jgi:hypothetical protein